MATRKREFQDDQKEDGAADNEATGRGASTNANTRLPDGGQQDQWANHYAAGTGGVDIPAGHKLYSILTQNAIIGGVKYDIGDKVALDPDVAVGYQRGGIGLEEHKQAAVPNEAPEPDEEDGGE